MSDYFLAIDIGASSGRHIIAKKPIENKSIEPIEVYRFENKILPFNNSLIWDIESLLKEVINGIKIAFSKYPNIKSLSIDTWAVDYVLMDNDKEIFPCYSYRDNRCEEIIDEIHSIIPFKELYQKTGCQFQKFNTIYQLYCDRKSNRLDYATDFLMIPEYLMFKLTGVKLKEFTNATTTGLINYQTLNFDIEIIDKLSLPRHLFTKISEPKKILGKLLPNIVDTVNGNCDVVLCATHDTASAVYGIPMPDNQLYISSGTWSLLGVKTTSPITSENSMLANYSNEGGVGYNRFQKNIMGLWVVNQLKKELCPDLSFDKIINLAKNSNFELTVDINSKEFLSPKSMKETFDFMLNKPLTIGDYFKCAYLSLAHSYKNAIFELELITEESYSKLYIVGGGAKNQYLNDLIKMTTKKEVIALPIEATSIGNLKIQMEV
ncbi:MAG: rhamnulokinase [Lachnospirales bacterium]